MSSPESPIGRECLSFTVSGPWGHFRRIEGNIVKQTYRIIPRTTVAGLVAAILGYDRDSYYDLFAREESLIAIEPRSPLRTINLPVNTLSTAGEDMTNLNSRGKLSVRLPDPTALRQQHNYEVLVEPSYRIDLWLSNGSVYESLQSRLEANESFYIPSLGLSEYLAEIEYHDEFEIEPHEPYQADVITAAPDVSDRLIPVENERYEFEQSPGFMRRDDGGRTTTGFISYAYNPAPGPITVEDAPTYELDDRVVMFT